jgi:hypothetical protein
MADIPSSAIGQQFGVLTNFFGTQRHTFSRGRFLQTDNSGGTAEYSTIGPERNEMFTTYTYAQGTHHIRFLAYVSPDILLVHQSKVAGFYRAMGSNDALDPIGRDVKDEILKGSNIHISNNTTSSSASSVTPVVANTY